MRIPDIYENEACKLVLGQFLEICLQAIKEDQFIREILQLSAPEIKGLGPPLTCSLYLLHPTVLPPSNRAEYARHIGGLSMRVDPAELRRRWLELSDRRPIRSRSEIARELDVSEAELLASRVGFGVIRLVPLWLALFDSIEALGPVQTITQNRHAAMIKSCDYSPGRNASDEWMFFDGGVALGVATKRLAFAFAYEPIDTDEREVSQTIEFYSESGEAVHRVLLTEDSSIDRFYDVVASFLEKEQSDVLEIRSGATPTTPVALDCDQFLEGWANLTSAEELFQFVQKYALSPGQVMASAGSRFARKVSNKSLQLIFDDVVGSELPIAIHLRNQACIQTCSGRFEKGGIRGGPVGLRNSDAAIHVNEDSISTAWIVEMPGMRTGATSLHVLDRDGASIVEIASAPDRSTLEEDRWRTLLDALPD